ncbi:hypothetical protein CDL15_Pgr021883 [Punica granatum]|uniref:Uncharacterized protein n=1 Tax=Punica granatum TaxID=22663 RepID=A0A218WT89_PUNGR|nr:hypothetical protein CDL15_Pgr021883 [Punica granatum]PKI54549.1 hypothetical protein CRG98_025063 [Punica granatum]
MSLWGTMDGELTPPWIWTTPASSNDPNSAFPQPIVCLYHSTVWGFHSCLVKILPLMKSIFTSFSPYRTTECSREKRRQIGSEGTSSGRPLKATLPDASEASDSLHSAMMEVEEGLGDGKVGVGGGGQREENGVITISVHPPMRST